jgi:DNA-binding beta-propeller fold protein YncE
MLPAANNGLEQPVYDSAQGVFIVSVPSTNAATLAGGTANAGGELDVINPKTMQVTKVFPTPASCAPQGLALKQSTEVLFVGCGGPGLNGSGGGVTFMSATTGAVLGQLAVTGVDEVWYNPTDNRFYGAGSNNMTGAYTAANWNPVLVVADGTSLALLAVVTTGASSHSVAADPVTNKVFVPVVAATAGSAVAGASGSFAAQPAPRSWPGGVAIFTHP